MRACHWGAAPCRRWHGAARTLTMNRRTEIRIAAGLALLLGGCVVSRPGDALSKEQAVATARRAIAGKVTLLVRMTPFCTSSLDRNCDKVLRVLPV